jgi:hypothetical protein
MEKKDGLTKTLAIIGTLLVWFPLLTPFLFSIIFYAAEHLLRFDYLMPAELFPSGLLGGVLLIWAARRASAQLRLVGWGLGVAITSLVLGQVMAELTGLASGEMEASGFWFVLVLISLAVYCLGLVAMAVGSVLLLKHLFKRNPDSIQNS